MAGSEAHTCNLLMAFSLFEIMAETSMGWVGGSGKTDIEWAEEGTGTSGVKLLAGGCGIMGGGTGNAGGGAMGAAGCWAASWA